MTKQDDFIQACEEGNINTIKEYLKEFDIGQNEKKRGIMRAAENGHFQILEILVSMTELRYDELKEIYDNTNFEVVKRKKDGLFHLIKHIRLY